ncbi:hypothetical protein [Baaleninema sp.]|uniref:hypothetical protein n=1 Tax=Baaleninema sp. TaxID=3101197 RepID=UPI003D0744D4
MPRKLTISLDELVYDGLHRAIDRPNIDKFIEDLVRPHVIAADIEAGYAAMAADEERENEALEWSEGLIEDVARETR